MPADNIGQILRIAYTSAIIRVPGIGISYVRKFTEKQAEELRKYGVTYPVPYDESPITVAQGYLKPLESRDWDLGILEHYKALISEGGLLSPGPSRESLPKHVLIIQGDEDPTVPAWVAEAYAEAQGGESSGVVYDEFEGVGHLPMEQDPRRFVEAVARHCDLAR
uniref:AB hydrolase-1 domain-containing protein n=1 Tax=Lotharella oceanica TaxID=641309 RepID=A0A7S2TSH3_9EUKA